MFALHLMIRECRRKLEMTQEDVANSLGVAPQTVSKWEREETYPDITLLPALANLFGITTDRLLGMEHWREEQRVGSVYTRAREKLRLKEWSSAIAIYEQALLTWPNDTGILTDLAMALALEGGENRLVRAEKLCKRVLHMKECDKVQHTARAALCYIYAKKGEQEQAFQTASQLPHLRESREVIRERLEMQTDWNAMLFELSTGEQMPE